MFGYPIKNAIGSSAALGFLISLVGALGFVISGSYLKIEAPLSIGFINIPAFLIFVPITMFMARIGAKTVHHVNKKIVGKLFGIFLFIVSCRLFVEYFSTSSQVLSGELSSIISTSISKFNFNIDSRK